MILTIKKQGGGTLFSKTLSRGWNYIGASLGAFMFPSGNVRVTNGVCDGDGAGTIFHGGIELRDSRLSRPRRWGTGLDVLIPRGSYRLRHPSAPEPHDCPDFGYAGGPRIPFAPTLRTVSPWWTYQMRQSGMYQVMGERQRDTPGAKGIEPVSGFEIGPAALIVRSDAMMNRTPLDAFTRSGYLFSDSMTYSDDVGWAKSTQLAQFCLPLTSNMYDERRKPKEWNSGTCGYYADLAGFVNPYDSWLPSNAQHEVRTLAPVIAAANCDDEMAQADLDVIAWNGVLAVSHTPAAQPGQGSTYFGTRATSWRMWGWMHSTVSAGLASAHVGQTVVSQMPNGGFQRASYGAPFSPSPWDTYGLTRTKDVEATMERWITCHVLASAGMTETVRRSLAGVFDTIVPGLGYVPKFVVVASDGSVVDTTHESVGPPDYFPWVALGALAALEPHADDWKAWALSIATPTQGKPTGLKDLRDRLRKEVLGRSQCVAMLSVLETLAL